MQLLYHMGPGGTFEEEIFQRKNVRDYPDPLDAKSSARAMSQSELRYARIESNRNNALKAN
jgi:hypothetical protein